MKSEVETLIRDLNLACRNISKKIVVANVDVRFYFEFSMVFSLIIYKYNVV